jgi:hypothetical protein
MESLFDRSTLNKVTERIERLTPNTNAQWGKMNVAQMLSHCTMAFSVPLSPTPLPRMFLGRLLGWAIKKELYNENPYKRNLPTAPEFKITTEKDFKASKENLLAAMNSFHQKGKEGIGDQIHPFFGKYTAEQWGMGMYKHLDHHLQQFGQ